MRTDFGYLSGSRLEGRVRALEAAAERRGWRPGR